MPEIENVYPLVALFINACGQEVTKDKMQSVFNHFQIDFIPKIASLFCLSSDKINDMLTSTSQPPAPVSGATTVAAKSEKVEEKPAAAVEEEESDLGYDDLFG